MNNLEKISHETMVFMRGKYRLDEIGDGKWMFIDVTTTEQLEEVKKLILIKKKPNRKPFPKENAIYSKCGQRCDLCVHFIGTTDEQRAVMIPNLNAMWDNTDWSMRCVGCHSKDCSCTD